jgi:hypothetical protein
LEASGRFNFRLQPVAVGDLRDFSFSQTFSAAAIRFTSSAAE